MTTYKTIVSIIEFIVGFGVGVTVGLIVFENTTILSSVVAGGLVGGLTGGVITLIEMSSTRIHKSAATEAIFLPTITFFVVSAIGGAIIGGITRTISGIIAGSVIGTIAAIVLTSILIGLFMVWAVQSLEWPPEPSTSDEESRLERRNGSNKDYLVLTRAIILILLVFGVGLVPLNWWDKQVEENERIIEEKRVSATATRIRSAHLQSVRRRYKNVCNGGRIREAPPYTDAPGVHFIISYTPTGDSWKITPIYPMPKEWQAGYNDIENVELVACIISDLKETGTCGPYRYAPGAPPRYPNLYQNVANVTIRESHTGDVIDSFDLSGSIPDSCPSSYGGEDDEPGAFRGETTEEFHNSFILPRIKPFVVKE
jgi:hypothetical protein